MNKQQREALSKLADQIDKTEETLSEMSKEERQEFRVSLEDVRRDVSDILEEEQEKYENMPESLQNGSRGEAMQEAIDNLEQAVEAIESAIANEDVEDEEWPANMESDLSDAVDLLNSF